MEIKIFAHRIDSPNSLDGRKEFTFDRVLGINVTENSDRSLHVTITSSRPPLVTYSDESHRRGCRYAEDSDLTAHCIRRGDEFIFPSVQTNCVWFGKGVWD